jgi:CIC family chloride channel protein
VNQPEQTRRLALRENQVFVLLTIVIGVLAGLSAVLFSLAIDATSRRLFGFEPSSMRRLAVPALMSLAAGLLLAWVFPDVRGSGIPQTKAAYHLHGGRMRWRIPIGKFITGVMCVGGGHSMGREGPSVQIGAGIASALGQWLELTPSRIRDLVPVGAAAALAAAFNTPVAAVLFALEEIIGDMNARLIGSAVAASVAAVIVARSILGDDPVFHVSAYQLMHPAELAAYAALGIVGGLVSAVFSVALLRWRSAWLRLPARTRFLQPALGGLMIGALLVVEPAVAGVGYEYVDQALNGEMVLTTMAALGALKILATITSYVSGNAGGIFAPTLFIGAMTGGTVGAVVNMYAPFPTAGAGAYALVGMGAVFAGIIRAPITSVIMIFELTQDYDIIVPLMVANMLSLLLSRRLQREPVYGALLKQDGIALPSSASEHHS